MHGFRIAERESVNAADGYDTGDGTQSGTKISIKLGALLRLAIVGVGLNIGR